MPSFNRKQAFFLFLKVAVFILLSIALYQQIFQERDFESFYIQLQNSLNAGNVLYLFLALILMPINWLLESYKWKLLMKNVEPLHFSQSIKSVLSGVTFTMFTPNRIGEYAGRFLFLKQPWNPNAWLANFAGSYSQIIVTLALGCGGAYFLLDYLLDLTGKDTLVLTLLNSLTATSLILSLAYFNSGWVIVQLNKYLFKYIFKKYRQLKKGLPLSLLTKTLFISLLRYTVYASQYLLLFWFFSIPLGFFEGMQFVTLIFLIQTIIPSLAILELGIRSNIALFLLMSYSGFEPEIFAAATLLWFINLLVPALVGYLFILPLGRSNS